MPPKPAPEVKIGFELALKFLRIIKGLLALKLAFKMAEPKLNPAFGSVSKCPLPISILAPPIPTPLIFSAVTAALRLG